MQSRYNVETCLISKLIETKDMKTIQDQSIDRHYFTGEDKNIFIYIQDTVLNTGDFPTERVIKSKFPSFKFEYVSDDTIGAEEGLNFLCEELRTKAKHNKIVHTLQETADLINNFDTENAVKKLRSDIAYIENDLTVTSIVDITKNTEDRVKSYERKRLTKGVEGIPTGFNLLDQSISGMCKGTVTTVIAKTGVGKSWLQVMMGAYCQLQGLKVLQLTTEMSNDIMQDRYEAMLFSLMYGSFNYNDFKKGNLPPDIEYQFIEFLRKDLPHLEPLILKDAKGVIGVREDIKNIKPDIVFIDGIYMMEDDQNAKDDWLRLTHITRDLKKAAKHTGIPININTQADINSKGGLGGIKYSQSLAQDADSVIELIREDTMYEDNEAKLIVRKNREGEPASIMVNWDFKTMNFKEIYAEGSFNPEPSVSDNVIGLD